MPVLTSFRPRPLPHPTALGQSRDWFWRGWRIRYTYSRALQPDGDREARESAPPIVFVHGFGSALTQWKSTLHGLRQHHTVYALDLLGFGASEKASTPYQVQLWADQLIEFWRSLIHTPIILVGHSLGAVVALTAAAQYPEMVKGLVLLTLPPSRPEVIPNRLEQLAFTVERWFANPVLLRPLFRVIQQPRLLKLALQAAYVDPSFVTEDLIEEFLTPMRDRGAIGVFSRLARARTDPHYTPDVTPLVQTFEKPILLIWGERDRVVPLSQGQHFPSLNPRLQWVTIPDAGHCLYDECSDRVNQEIRRWISDTLEQIP